MAFKSSLHVRCGAASLEIEGGLQQVMQQWQPSDDSGAERQLQRQLVSLAMISRNPEDMQQDALHAHDINLGGNSAAAATGGDDTAPSAAQGQRL